MTKINRKSNTYNRKNYTYYICTQCETVKESEKQNPDPILLQASPGNQFNETVKTASAVLDFLCRAVPQNDDPDGAEL